MTIKDIFNKDLRIEKKRKIGINLPHFVITSEFLNMFNDISIRDKIYKYVIDNNLTQEKFNNFIELYKLNKVLATSYLDDNISVPKEALELSEFNYWGFVYNCIILKEKYGKIVIPYLKENFDLYQNILYGNEKIIDILGIEFVLKYPVQVKKIGDNLDAFSDESLLMVAKIIKNGELNKFESIINIYNNQKRIIPHDFMEVIIKDIDLINVENFSYKKMDDVIHGNNSIPEYRKLRQDYYDMKFNESLIKKNLEVAKKELFRYTTGESLYILNTWTMKDETEKMKYYLDILKEINMCSNISELEMVRKKIDFDNIDFYKEYEECLRKNVKQTCFKPNLEGIKANSEGIYIIDNSNCDLTSFNFLIHCMAPWEMSNNRDLAKEVIDNPQLWDSKTENSSSILSCSMVSDYAFNVFSMYEKDKIILGFSSIDDIPIIASMMIDAGTLSNNGNKIFNRNNNIKSFVTFPSDLTSKYRFDGRHNEVALGRQGVKPSFIISYLNYNGKDLPIDDRMKKWAKYFNIPIVQIDFKLIYEKSKEDYDNIINIISNEGCNLENFKKLIYDINKMKNYNVNLIPDLFDLINEIIRKNISIGSYELIDESISIIEMAIENEYNIYDIDKQNKYKSIYDMLMQKKDLYDADSLSQNHGISV